MPQPHGGALLPGGTGAPGTGRPADRVRAALRKAGANRIKVLKDIADGNDPEAKPADRVRAVDTMLRYGIGTIQEMSVDAVRGRLAQTIALIRDHFPPEQAEPLLEKMADLWE